MILREEIKETIRSAVVEVTDLAILDDDTCLLDSHLRIPPVAFLYIFDIIEKQLNFPVCDFFAKNTFEVMTLKNLTEALYYEQTLAVKKCSV